MHMHSPCRLLEFLFNHLSSHVISSLNWITPGLLLAGHSLPRVNCSSPFSRSTWVPYKDRNSLIRIMTLTMKPTCQVKLAIWGKKDTWCSLTNLHQGCVQGHMVQSKNSPGTLQDLGVWMHPQGYTADCTYCSWQDVCQISWDKVNHECLREERRWAECHQHRSCMKYHVRMWAQPKRNHFRKYGRGPNTDLSGTPMESLHGTNVDPNHVSW